MMIICEQTRNPLPRRLDYVSFKTFKKHSNEALRGWI